MLADIAVFNGHKVGSIFKLAVSYETRDSAEACHVKFIWKGANYCSNVELNFGIE